MPQKPPQIIADLIERFEQNAESYRSPGYNEAQVRKEFIDPLFEALGWDLANKAGHAEAYKDVIHEDAIKVGAPDYCFRIGGSRKFFLEAKKPAVNVKDDPDPAYQLKRYAWSAKLPLSILTDFEEFAVYECLTRPRSNDKASVGRTLYLTYKDYSTRWDEIASVFAKDAVFKGSFDKYVVSERKHGTATVDTEFLAEIEKWRDALARNLAVRNTALDVHELNFAVQRTIDRIIFLRICEDRGIEPYAQLQALLNGENIYGRLRHLYDQADDRYNSGLFHFRPEKERAEAPDELTLKLKIDDKVLKDIIHGLYYPESPYEFSVMPAEILGQVYEQFLGKVIRLTSGHQAKIEEKPEVKKAGGVYYTPTYIVEYIVQNTVGKLLEDAMGSATVPVAASGVPPEASQGVAQADAEGSRRDAAKSARVACAPLDARSASRILNRVSKLRILDPACGSGSFLLGAYEFLLQWHLDFYAMNDPVKWAKGNKPVLVQTSGGWRLT